MTSLHVREISCSIGKINETIKILFIHNITIFRFHWPFRYMQYQHSSNVNTHKWLCARSVTHWIFAVFSFLISLSMLHHFSHCCNLDQWCYVMNLHKQFAILKKCHGKFKCFIYEMLLIRKKRPTPNTQKTLFQRNCLVPFAYNHEAWTFFVACLFFKRDSYPDNCLDWTNENVSFWARNYECFSKKCGTFCSRGVQLWQTLRHVSGFWKLGVIATSERWRR